MFTITNQPARAMQRVVLLRPDIAHMHVLVVRTVSFITKQSVRKFVWIMVVQAALYHLPCTTVHPVQGFCIVIKMNATVLVLQHARSLIVTAVRHINAHVAAEVVQIIQA